MSKRKEKSKNEYRKYVTKSLSALRPVFARASLGDFSSSLRLPEKDDEFAELYAGIQIMIKVMRDQVSELDDKVLKLQKSELQIEAVLESIGEGMVATDVNGTIFLANDAALELLKTEKKSLLGKDIEKQLIIESEDGKKLPAQLRPLHQVLLRTKKITAKDYWFRRFDNTRFPAVITATPILLNGKIIGAIEIFRNLTHEHEIDKAKTEFVSLTSHELRTPLTIIRWSADMLKKEDLLNGQQLKYVERIRKVSAIMADLIQAFLNASRIELGTLSVRPQFMQIRDVIDRTVEEMRFESAEKGIRLVYKKISLPKINIDPELLRVAVQNLLSNAIKYTPKKGRVLVQYKKTKTRISMTIQDTGIGIPPDDHKKIFTRLYRASNAKRISAHGTGLGLYITKALVEKLNGKIDFISRVNKGTTFKISFPIR